MRTMSRTEPATMTGLETSAGPVPGRAAPAHTVADYLFNRLAELGCTEIFGVPGDYNLPFLDVVDDHPELRWVGNANELNASYAADAYARARGLAAMVTTFGVGELSAVNGIAGAYAEYAPVLHVVGAPRTELRRAGLSLHHSLGDGDFDHFRAMYSHVTCADAVLTPENAAAEIDRVLRAVLLESRPGYLLLSPDVAAAPIYRAATPLHRLDRETSPDAREAFRAAAARMLDGRTTTILADLLVHRLGALPDFDRLLAATEVPYLTSAWGKTLVDESSPRFAGIYAGNASRERSRAAVEDAETLVSIGVRFNDTITAGFSGDIDPARVIEVRPGVAAVGEVMYAPLAMRDAIGVLVELAQERPWTPMPLAEPEPEPGAPRDEHGPLLQADLWPAVAASIAEGQTVLADQGTSFFGLAMQQLPKGVMFLGQPMWGSIGYTLPATLGAALGRPDHRALLLIGDGSAQLTVQELGVLIRERVNPVIVLVNNSGYTVERRIHGADRIYNDICPWDWCALPAAMGGDGSTALSMRVTTLAELREALDRAAAEPDKLVLIEAVTGRDDCPPFLEKVAENL